MPPKLTLYLDLISPFAYLTFFRLLSSPLLAYTSIKPAFLGGIMSLSSNRPPLTIPLKGAYIFQDLKRQAVRYNIPLLPSGKPEKFPINTLYAMRVVCATPEERRVDVIQKLYETFWVEGRSIEDERVVDEIVEKVLGKEWAGVKGRVATEGKRILQENTEEAVGKGAFGMPWFVVTDAMGIEDVYWGFDHLDEVAELMGVPVESRNSGSKL